MADCTSEEVKTVVLNARKFDGADLAGVHLNSANLSKANLYLTDLSGATVNWLHQTTGIPTEAQIKHRWIEDDDDALADEKAKEDE